MERYSDKESVFALLDSMGILYHRQDHRVVRTMEDVESSGVVREGIVLKNLFLKDGKGRKHFLVCVPETAVIDFRSLGALLGEKQLGLASPERLKKRLGVDPGCVSPLNVLNDEKREVVVVLDGGLPDGVIVGIHPNDSTASAWMEYRYVKQIVEECGNDVVYLGFDRVVDPRKQKAQPEGTNHEPI